MSSRAENGEILQSAVHAKAENVYLEERVAVVEAYRDKYGTDWKKHIVNDIMAANPDAKRASVRRQFEYDKKSGQERYKNTGRVKPGTRERFSALGKSLAPIGKKAPEGGFTVTVKGKTYDKKGRSRDREFTTKITGEKADRFANNPTYYDFFESFRGGMGSAYGEEGEYDLDEIGVEVEADYGDDEYEEYDDDE